MSCIERLCVGMDVNYCSYGHFAPSSWLVQPFKLGIISIDHTVVRDFVLNIQVASRNVLGKVTVVWGRDLNAS